jgi:hypothetical protein
MPKNSDGACIQLCSGERGLQEGGGVLLPSNTCRPERRRTSVGVRQTGLGRAPRRGARLQLLRAGCQGFPAEQVGASRTFKPAQLLLIFEHGF